MTLWLRLLVLGCALGVAAPACAQVRAVETMRIWPGSPPGETSASGAEKVGNEGMDTGAYSNVSEPRVEIYRPAKPNGTAVMVIGGGGYFRIQIGSAARPIAQWLAERGVTAFVLFYRLPADGWLPNAPFQDGQRAVRMLREHAAELNFDPAKFGVIGLSAGGNLAGILATRGDDPFYPTKDAADKLSGRPDFAGLIYPVISLEPPIDTTRTAKFLRPQADAVAAYSVEKHVSADTPPVFLAHALDDPIADPRHSLWMAEAMRAAKRPVELHLFAQGGHSWGLGKAESEVSVWPILFARWASAHGFPIQTDK